MPAAETQREADLFDVLSLIFLEPRQSLPARRAVGRAFGDANLEMLIAFLAFTRTAHYWTETHPELEYEPDMSLLMKEHGLVGSAVAQSVGGRTHLVADGACSAAFRASRARGGSARTERRSLRTRCRRERESSAQRRRSCEN